MAEAVVDVLLKSHEPSIRWKVRSQVLGESDRTPRPLRRRLPDGNHHAGRLDL